MRKDIDLSIIIPVYNAESFIRETLLRLTRWKSTTSYQSQIILVNDGSKDATKRLIEDYIKLNDTSLELLTYASNRGKGYAVKLGMLKGVGKYRIFTDSDLPYGLDIFAEIYYYLDFKEFDVCIGNRKSKHSKYLQEISKLRKLSSKVFTFIISRYVVTGVKDTQCGIKGFKGEVAEKLFNKLQINGFAFDVEALYYCYKYDYEIKRIPVIFEGNSISTIRLSKDSAQMLRDIIYLPIRYHIFQKNRN